MQKSHCTSTLQFPRQLFQKPRCLLTIFAGSQTWLIKIFLSKSEQGRMKLLSHIQLKASNSFSDYEIAFSGDFV